MSQGNAHTTINLLTTRFWPDSHGGTERRMWHFATGLAGYGQRVNVITENRVNAAPCEYLGPNLTIRRVKTMQPGPLWRWREWPRVLWWRNAVRRLALPGTILANDPMAAAGVILAGRKRDLIFQPPACVAGADRVSRAYPEVTSLRASRSLIWLDRWVYRRAPRVIVETDNIRQQIAEHYGRTSGVRVIANGVDVPHITDKDRDNARARFGLADGQWVVGFVGRLDPCKDLPFLFKAVALGALGDEGKLLIVGDGPDRQRLDGIAASLGIAERLIWAGKLDDPTPAYAAIDALVLPSVYESFGLVLVEAMGCGVPVLGRRRSNDAQRPVLVSCDQIIRDGQTGLLVDSHDPADLARKLGVLRDMPAARESMGRVARRNAAEQPWSEVIEKYLQSMGIEQPRSLRQAS